MVEQESYITLHQTNTFNEDCQKLGFTKPEQCIIQHVMASIMNAQGGYSKLILDDNDTTRYILGYDGYTGTLTRHFYNNVCSKEGTRYLEIGPWSGSSSMSAMYGNNVDAVFIDNWSQFDGDASTLIDNLEKVKTTGANYKLIESDCWKVDDSSLGKFNVYLFDGDHSEQDHYQALNHYMKCLDDVFIFLVDDWMWPNVRDGTMRGISTLGLQILFRHEIFLSPEDLNNMPYHKGRSTWWNGIGIFVLKKTH